MSKHIKPKHTSIISIIFSKKTTQAVFIILYEAFQAYHCLLPKSVNKGGLITSYSLWMKVTRIVKYWTCRLKKFLHY